ncbi:hypothetical protein [Streptomyces sp. NBC_00328]|uniref:hypothetical protein n=1 Tax=Streptomyces sp. NBC_00328 TaxID=2903646 RepID=UPI002E2AA18B|nr:hypothetical protein [Streptomyces sp. NBC_00328]
MNYFSSHIISPQQGGQDRPQSRRPEPGQWPKAEAALAVVNRDLTATLPGQEALVLMLDPSWEAAPGEAADGEQIHVALPDGRWHGNAVNATDLEDGDPPEPDDAMTVLSVVADAAQATVMELLWQVWPVCREHKTGMHPRPAGTSADWYPGATDAAGPPVWWCRGGRSGACHDVCPVGELAATLP